MREWWNGRYLTCSKVFGCGCGGMVDTLVLGTSEATRGGSSPLIRTKTFTSCR